MPLIWTSQMNTSNDNFSFYFMTCFGFFSFPLGKIIWHVIHLGSEHHTEQMLSFVMYFLCAKSSDFKWKEFLMLLHQPLRNRFWPLKMALIFRHKSPKTRAPLFPPSLCVTTYWKPPWYHPQSVFVIGLYPTTIWNHPSLKKKKPQNKKPRNSDTLLRLLKK